MEIIKDFTEDLNKLEEQDRFFLISGRIAKMMAPQNDAFSRPYSKSKPGWGEISRTEETVDGTPQDLRTPKSKRGGRKGTIETKTSPCWSFKTGKIKIGDKEEDHLFLPWSGQYGIFKSSLCRSLAAQKKQRYEVPPLGLMRVYPEWLDIGPAPCDTMKDGANPEIIKETRHTAKGDVMVDVFWDHVKNRTFRCLVEVDHENPVDDAKFVSQVKTLTTLDPVGPSKRGRLKILQVQKVKLAPEELEAWDNGNVQWWNPN